MTTDTTAGIRRDLLQLTVDFLDLSSFKFY
jgi:hypothetical protein